MIIPDSAMPVWNYPQQGEFKRPPQQLIMSSVGTTTVGTLLSCVVVFSSVSFSFDDDERRPNFSLREQMRCPDPLVVLDKDGACLFYAAASFCSCSSISRVTWYSFLGLI